jgi:uncharacterized membrane protein
VGVRPASPERVSLFSDAVFAVIMTILVLELKPPKRGYVQGAASIVAHWFELCGELPVHRDCLDQPPLSVPFRRRGDAAAVVVNFMLVNITYVALCWEAVDQPSHEGVSRRMRWLLRMRSFVTILVFALAALIAVKWPVIAVALICLCLIGNLRPDIPEPSKPIETAASKAKP